MAVKLSAAMVASTFFLDAANSQSIEDRKARNDAEALEYLRAKFPEVDEEIFYTDYTGAVADHIVDVLSVCKAGKIEQVCAKCNGSKCLMPKLDGKPIVSIKTSPKGFKFLDVGWTCGLSCRRDSEDADFERMFRRSGLVQSQRGFTFGNYKTDNNEFSQAKAKALDALYYGTNLVIAGKWGTGKTHLAVAIAMNMMRKGRQAIFRLVSAMLDEIQTRIRDNGDYDDLMRLFKTVPCLVLDDLGHENMTAARASYLHQIIDYRYSESLQTIITTNATTPEELSRRIGEEFIAPILSRILGHGSWVTITNADDHRLQRRK